jgi:hypothetical protein
MVLLSIDHEDPRRFGDLAGFFAAAAATGGPCSRIDAAAQLA